MDCGFKIEIFSFLALLIFARDSSLENRSHRISPKLVLNAAFVICEKDGEGRGKTTLKALLTTAALFGFTRWVRDLMLASSMKLTPKTKGLRCKITDDHWLKKFFLSLAIIGFRAAKAQY